MAVENVSGATIITGPHIQLFQMRAQIGAIRLETKGLKHSGGSVTAKVKAHYGWKGNRAAILAQLEALYEQTKAELA